jgi:hypothetical protein
MDSTGAIIADFNSDNSPFQRNVYWSEIWIENYNDKTILISKNGLRLPTISSWDVNQSVWQDILVDDLLDQSQSGDPKIRYLLTPSYTDVEIIDDNLYVSTTLAGCVGIHKFELETIYTLEFDNFSIVQDSRFQIGQCLQGIQIENQRISIFSQRSLYIGMVCE